MNLSYSNTKFKNELENSLPNSSSAERQIWATSIIEKGLDIKDLSTLLSCDKKVALRFTWLLSEIGEINPNKLLSALPFLFELSDKIKHIDFVNSFATYWRIAGIPCENEAKAIDLLFGWLQSASTNVTTKSRALFVLFELTKKYPELKNELKLCLMDQLDKNSNDFNKRANKILTQLG